MQNAISVFQFQAAQSVRVEIKNSEPWFCLKDVAEILEIPRSSDLLQVSKGFVKNDTLKNRGGLKQSGIEKISLQTGGGKQELTFINEPNLYRVIFRSNKPEAVKFQDWIFEEVIPAIRKTGSYSNPAAHRTLNEWEQHQIQVAVKQRSARTGETTQAVYAKLHAYMQCSSYLHICQADFQTALNFLASIQDAPELFRQPEIQGIVFTEEEVYNFTVVTRYAQCMSLFIQHLEHPLRQLGSAYLAQAESWADEPHSWICRSQRSLMAAFKQMRNPKYINGVQSNFAKMQ